MPFPKLIKLASRVLAQNLYSKGDAEELLNPATVPREALRYFRRFFLPVENLDREMKKRSLIEISTALERRRLTRNFYMRLTFTNLVGGKVYLATVHLEPRDVVCIYKLAGAPYWSESPYWSEARGEVWWQLSL
jgi:hypothetical protein